MTPEAIYQKIVEKVNLNHSNRGASMDRYRAVSLFNEYALKYLSWVLEKRNNASIIDVQHLLVTESVKFKSQDSEGKVLFPLPDDFFSYSSVDVYASTPLCKNQFLLAIPKKAENISIYLTDVNWMPSFKHRETLYTYENNSVAVYTNDFTIEKIKLRYYKKPRQFNVSGYIDENDKNSYDVEPEFKEKSIDKIIDMLVRDYDINNENLQKVSLDESRIITKY